MSTSRTRKRRTRADGERSYQLIVDTAARLATMEGLEGLSIGRLADEIGMSKSGLYAHFDSKQDLQLAAVDAAEAVYTTEVIAPAMQAPEGLKRLESLCEHYLSYVERGVFPGGCFFAATAAEWDTRRGPVRERVRTILDGWTQLLEANVREAQQQGDLQRGTEPSSDQLRTQRPATRGERPLPALPGHRRARPGPHRDPRPTHAFAGQTPGLTPAARHSRTGAIFLATPAGSVIHGGQDPRPGSRNPRPKAPGGVPARQAAAVAGSSTRLGISVSRAMTRRWICEVPS